MMWVLGLAAKYNVTKTEKWCYYFLIHNSLYWRNWKPRLETYTRKYLVVKVKWNYGKLSKINLQNVIRLIHTVVVMLPKWWSRRNRNAHNFAIVKYLVIIIMFLLLLNYINTYAFFHVLMFLKFCKTK